MRKRHEEYMSGNLTAMIDVVFQLIIFFVATVSLQDQTFDATLKLAMAPDGQPVTAKNPLEVVIDVNSEGQILMGRIRYDKNTLGAILRQTAGTYGSDNVPIIIRGDGRTRHQDIKTVMDQCTGAGMYRIKFAAVKEAGQ
jgi:biopolymer transport protein ExbD